MSEIRNGSIVKIDFPYADLPEAKRRPCLVLTAPDKGGECILCMITSSPLLSDKSSIEIMPGDVLEGYLPKHSRIRYGKLYTVSAVGLTASGRLLPKRCHEAALALCDLLKAGHGPVDH